MAATNPTDSETATSSGEQSTAHSIQLQENKNTMNSADALAADETPEEHATGLMLFLVMLSVCMSTLLVGLELGIISTAIPGITGNFHRIQDVGWYGCATFLLVAASSSVWGKVYKYLNVKFAYLTSILFVLIGSIVSAAAPNSASIIVGRAIQGLGIGGTLSGSVIVINHVAHPEKHPLLIGIWTGVFVIATILGPLVGGAFTTKVSWRWCFWINLPLGGPIIALVILFLHIPKHVKPTPATWKEILLQLDLPGFTFLLASLVVFALALQQGGQMYAWSAGSTIALLVLWPCLTIAFVVIERVQGARALVALKILKPRLTWTNALYAYFTNAANYQMIFYLPVYLQSIHGMSAIKSGVNLLPFLAFFAVGAVVSGGIIGKTRYLQPYQLISGLLSTAGMALFYNLKVDSSKGWYIGPQVVLGLGLGFGNQIPMTAVQGLSKPEDMATSSGIILMMQALSGTYFIIIAQSIFTNRMLYTLRTSYPNINTGQVLNSGANELQQAFRGADLAAVLDAYMVGIKGVLAFSLATAALTVLLSLAIPFQRLPDHSIEKTEETKEIVAAV